MNSSQPLSIESVKAIIRTHRSHGTFLEGAQFIRSLPQSISSAISVAIEIAQLYLVQWQYILATQACENVSMLSGGEDAVALELLQAFISIGRYSKLKTALRIAQRIGDTWQIDHARGPPTNTYNTIHAPPQDRETPRPSGGKQGLDIGVAGVLGIPVTEYRVLIVFYYWKIMVVAAEQGLLDEKSTKAAATLNIAPLLLQMRSDGRLREARFLLYFMVNIMCDTDKALETLREFLQCLDDSQAAWATERASTLVDIAEFQLRSDSDAVLAEAAENFRRAGELFSSVGHIYGIIDIDLIRTTADQTISAGEKFIAKTKIAGRYFEVHNYQNGIRCLSFAISPEMSVDIYHEDVAKAVELLNRMINEVGGEILKQVSLLHSIGQASLKATEYGFALRSLESYYANVPEEISPKFHSYMGVMLGLVYSSFGDAEKALQAAEESLEIAMSGVSYIDQSDAATHVGMHRLNLARQHPQGSTEAIHYTTSAVELLAEWADRDAENGYADGEVQKCLQIAEHRGAHDQALGSEPAEQHWIDRVKKHIPDSANPLTRSQVVDLEMRSLMRRGRFTESLALSADYLEQLGKVSGVPPFKMAQAFMSASTQALLCVQSSFQQGQTSTPESTQSAVKLLWTTVSLS